MMGSAFKTLIAVRGFSTVPGLIALALWGLSLLCLQVDVRFPEFATQKPFKVFYTDYETARSVVSTVSSASITTLGLVYSIVLVVFTTAAGNIGPRLLKRFTGDSVNQFTAGLFGGTYLFALTVLHQTSAEQVPTFSIAVTFLLAGLSVLQLIFFVHKASQSVTIDDEIAEIAGQMETEISKLVHDEEGLDQYDADPPGEDEFLDEIHTERSGYITSIDNEPLVALAQKHDLVIGLVQGQGNFIVPGLPLARLTKKLDDSERDAVVDELRQCVGVGSTRSPAADVEFSISLLIEIALRALSPGVNDTYTAITCVDRISSALTAPARDGMRDGIRADEDKKPRLWVPGLTLEELLNTAFNPLRRAAGGNVLMSKHILDALARLNSVADDEAQELVAHHADLMVESSRDKGLIKEDFDYLMRYRRQNIQRTVNA